jgi:pyruvyl transferase EpsO
VRYAPTEPAKFLSDGLIYLHGGGNFGDIWPAYQVYREEILRLYPNNRIVQLPQSIHFQKPEGIERTKRAIGAHRDFHFMVRDHESLDFATKHFDCPVMLVSDSAFGIGMRSFPRVAKPSGIKCLFRSDKERRADAQAGVALFAGATVEDWDRRNKPRQIAEKAAMGALMAIPQVPGKGALMALRERAFTAMARSRVGLGFAQLDTAEVVVTDRLHGHIMASLLGKPHVVIDNFYGKIANFIKAWPADGLTLQARDYAQAHDMAQQLLADQRAKR